ncbi:peptide/nickel transport system substrate-binding protein [Pseudorhodobacter antarcticus]|jgi:peptide/nickel transport system substrate-binding protein|uniref:Peptide/nickel transport system substrate-binding protein n=1 Tax=Pseudorhodobacter antarcticus TaxID=1077947 RepID=A0A1H8GDI7_9RHOB|nr:peptide ABC transporter substrate-binding protein [Pseudorhodobacter antarcticus]SEN41567.1 peptide/nickel transport system substrate-binding protein [Pseudorhodobacter antarcticus]
MKMKTALLGAACAFAFAPAAFAERGADGNVKVLYSQAVSIMNAYLSSGTKDVEVGSIVLEPLAGFDEVGTMFPRLVTELPSLENGGIAEDLTSVTWKITPGLLWSDGTAFTADDVVFTAAYCMDPAGGCAQLAKYEGVQSVEAIDPLTVKVTFTGPKPNPLVAFVGAESPILQKAQFANCTGAAAPTCTEANFNPIGTGPFMVTDFKVNDSVEFVANPNYRDPAKPNFATLSVKGGGDAASAARAVMETGEFDYAWNTQINPELQAAMAAGGKGQFVTGFGTLVERIEMNMTDPSPDLPEGERSTAMHPHPILSDVNVRKALSMAIDRSLLVEVGYGASGRPTCNLVPAPAIYASPNTDCIAQDMDGAKALLDAAGWVVGADGVREKDGKRFKLLYQTSVNPVRQDFQALIKGWWNELGVEVELKTIDSGIFFGGDPGSPDTFQKFYADVEMYANNFPGTDPEPYIVAYTCDKAPKPESQWQGENINRFCDPVFDELAAKLITTKGEAERAAIVIRMNEMLTKDTYTIVPLVDRGRLSAHSNTLGGVVLNVWDSEMHNVQDWFRIK